MNWCDPVLLLKSEEHHRGNLRLTLFLFDVFRAVFLVCYGCFPWLLFYFFLLVRSFSSVYYIYIFFEEKLEHLRDTENETFMGNGRHQEIGVLTLSKLPI